MRQLFLHQLIFTLCPLPPPKSADFFLKVSPSGNWLVVVAHSGLIKEFGATDVESFFIKGCAIDQLSRKSAYEDYVLIKDFT